MYAASGALVQRPAAGRSVAVHEEVRSEVGALVLRARDGDAAAWDDIVARFTSLLWAIARAHRLNQADAGDVVQSVWLKLVEHLDRIQDPDRLAGWLATTARRECLGILRRSGREVVSGVDDTWVEVVDELAPRLDAALLTEERDRALWQCFTGLSERCQHLLRVLMATDPPAYTEVAEAIGMPIGSIGPTRMRCLDRLRKITRDAGYAFADLTDGSTS